MCHRKSDCDQVDSRFTEFLTVIAVSWLYPDVEPFERRRKVRKEDRGRKEEASKFQGELVFGVLALGGPMVW